MQLTIAIIGLAALTASAMSCACSSEEYDLEPGEGQTFLVEGDSPRLDATTGSAEITNVQPLGGGLSLVTVECLDTSSANCTGTLYGC